MLYTHVSLSGAGSCRYSKCIKLMFVSLLFKAFPIVPY